MITGAKYDSKAFKKSVAHGVGVKAVKALSSRFIDKVVGYATAGQDYEFELGVTTKEHPQGRLMTRTA
jgi:DNA gyrase/topoisomerase IV subunit B